MSKYDYKCLDCGSVFKIEASIKEKEEDKGGKFFCPKCQSKKNIPQFSPANFIKNIFSVNNKEGKCCLDNKSDGCCGNK